jgi:hypothetical protein
MAAPSFTAESGLYRSTNHYRSRSGAFLWSDTSTVRPQACGWLKGIACGAGVAGAIAVCADACVVTGGVACYGCIVAALATLGLGGCADCIPTDFRPNGGSAGGGGGVGPTRQCCEFNAAGRCIIFKPPGGQCP